MMGDDGLSLFGNDHMEIRSKGISPVANVVNGVELMINRLVGDMFGDER